MKKPNLDDYNLTYHVLICGHSFAGLSLAERDQAREELRFELFISGIILLEHIWIWDETNQAQLEIASYKSAQKAQTRKTILEAEGFRVRIV